jgi:hypothetical protein
MKEKFSIVCGPSSTRVSLMFIAALIGTILLAACEAPSSGSPSPQPTVTATTTSSYGLSPASVPGIQGDASTVTDFPGIPWVRLGYQTCSSTGLGGQALKNTIQAYHNQGMHVLLTYCQVSGSGLLNTQQLNDVAQAGADAVQCGNEQMKQSSTTTYVAPADFARFYDLCQNAVHNTHPGTPVILGAMDPWVVPNDNAHLMQQVQYLDAMQSAMNSSVHPGGHWNWRSQILGLIDSWHNGYPDSSTNNLLQLYLFWSQQLNVPITSLGEHIWVIEGTGCVSRCGLDTGNARQVAISHILTLITDVMTTMKYHVPFFYFSGKDFYSQIGLIYGVLDVNGHPKPLRQDLPMNAVTLTMSCPSGNSVVANQEQLLAKLYSGCTPPAGYVSILAS